MRTSTRSLRAGQLAAVAVAAVMVMAVLGPIPAGASYPGENGRLAAAIGSSCTGSDLSIYTMKPDGTDVRVIGAPGGARHPEWSPDGKQIAYHNASEDIYIVDHDGSNRQFVTHGRWPSWSPDGARLVYERPVGTYSDLWTIELASGVKTQITVLEEEYSYPQFFSDWHRNPEWSPVSDVIVFERLYATREYLGDIVDWGGLWTVNADGTSMAPLAEFNEDEAFYGFYQEPEWAPDGSAVAIRFNRAGGDDVAVVSAGGGAPAVITDLDISSSISRPTPAWAPDGNTVAYNTYRPVAGGPSERVIVVDDEDVYTTFLNICGLDWQRVPDWTEELTAAVWANEGPPGYAALTDAAVGDEFTVSVAALNTGEIALNDVMPLAPEISGTGTVELVSGPEPAGVASLGVFPPDFAIFDYRFRATGPGPVVFTARVVGTGATGTVTSEPSASDPVAVTGPTLTVEVTVDPSEALTGDTVTVTVDVTNDGTQPVTDVTPADPVASSDDEGEVTKTSGPDPASVATLAPGASTVFTYEYSADSDGTVRFDASVEATGPADATVSGEFTCPTEGETTCTVTIAGNVIVVNSTGPNRLVAGSTICDTGEEIARDGEPEPECTLPAAARLANSRAGTDTIEFDIPDQSGVPLIQADRISFTDRVIIDGTTQPGAGRIAVAGLPESLEPLRETMNTVDCTALPPSNYGLALLDGSAGSEVRGMALYGHGMAGLIVAAASSGNVIEDNYFGTDGSRALGNGVVCRGRDLHLPNPYVGGGALIRSGGNTISGNLFEGNGSLDPVSGPLAPIQGVGLRIEGPGGNSIVGNVFRGGSGLLGRQSVNLLVADSPGNYIGSPGEANTFDFGRDADIRLYGEGASGNVVRSNLIGAAGRGSKGVVVSETPQNTIGGSSPGDGNVLGCGVTVLSSDRVRVVGNSIGVGTDGATRFGDPCDYGINLEGATNAVVTSNVVSRSSLAGIRATGGSVGNLITGNRIFGNGSSGNPGAGVLVAATNSPSEQNHANTIRGNQIFDNTGLGIDLGGDGPDPRDSGSWLGEPAPPNQRIAAPAVDVVSDGAQTLLMGNVVTPVGGGAVFIVEFFTNNLCDPSGHGEGRELLAAVAVTSGLLSPTHFEVLIPQPVGVGTRVAATVTDPAGNTSEFSLCRQVRAGSGLAESAAAGDDRIDVADQGPFSEGDRVIICPGCPNQESNVVTGFGSLILATPLLHDHGTGEIVVIDDSSARELKEQARAMVLPYASYAHDKVAKRAAKALERIDDSLARPWLGPDQLDPKVGKKVFDDERKAVHELLKLLHDGRLSEVGIADISAAIAALIDADRILASVAMTEAEAACAEAASKDRDRCEKELQKAAEEWEKATSELAKGKPDKAVDRYGKVWEGAMKANGG